MANPTSPETLSLMEWAQRDFTDITLWLGVAAGLYVGLRLLEALVARILKTDKLPPNSIRNIAGHFIDTTNSLFLIPFALIITAPFFVVLPGEYGTWLRRIFMIAAILQVAFWAKVVAQAVLEGVVTRNAADASTLYSARSVLSLFINVAIFAVATIMIIDNLGGDVTGLIAGLGVGGIAIGLAAQNIFQDLFASLSIILDKPFVKGDFVSFKGFNGTVEKIGLKTTRLKALSGEQLVVSNANLLSNEIQNYKRMNERRVAFTLGVTYQAPRSALEVLPEKIQNIIDSRDLCRFDRSHLSAYGASSIDFETVYFVKSREYLDFMNEQQAIFLQIHALFEELGVEFAYPTQTLFVEKDA